MKSEIARLEKQREKLLEDKILIDSKVEGLTADIKRIREMIEPHHKA